MGVGPEQNHGFGVSRGRRCVAGVWHAVAATVVVVEQRRRRRRRRCWRSGVGGGVTGNGRVEADDSVRACELPSPPILKSLCSEWRACGRTSCSGNGAAGRGAVNVRHRRRHRKQRPPPQRPPSPPRTAPPLLPSTPRTLPPPPPLKPLTPSRRDLQIAATTSAADRGSPPPSPPTPPPPPFARRSGDASDATYTYILFPVFKPKKPLPTPKRWAASGILSQLLYSPIAPAEIACTCWNRHILLFCKRLTLSVVRFFVRVTNTVTPSKI